MKRMLACFIIVAAFPLLASLTHNKSNNPVPFATVAFAGHVLTSGVYCECNDPNTHTGAESISAVPDQDDGSLDQVDSPVCDSSDSGLDFDSGAVMIALALFIWTRLRA
jgi:hypothetical protein